MNRTVLYLLLFLLVTSCSESTTKKGKTSFEVDTVISEQLSTSDNNKQEDVIFYNFFSPVDLNRLISNRSSYFNSQYINPLDNITKYTVSHKVALNIGVYGADLSYLWMFEQKQQAMSYLSAIRHLTAKLGIPDNFVDFTMESLENSEENPDSLIALTRSAYYATDKYLKSNMRENSAALILLGGWIESLYITLNMYTEPDAVLASKIISQKYSLSSLITMIQNNQNDIIMSEYLLMMKKLNRAFADFESALKPGDIVIDTNKKTISVKPSAKLNIEPQQFNDIKTLTRVIRKRITE